RDVPVVQYVAPTVWAWRSGRVKTIRRHVRRLLVTLPFEPEVYAGSGVDAVYVGNPAADRIPADPPAKAEVADRLGADADVPWVGLVPGSREAEIGRMGPLLAAAGMRVREACPSAELVVPLAPGVEAATVADALEDAPAVRVVSEKRLEALSACQAAIATSGTVSLELALLGVPHAVAYRTSTVEWAIARALVHVDHVALPNLIAGRTVVPEYLQSAATPEALAAPVVTWLAEPEARAAVVAELAAVQEAVGPSGTAGRAATAALEALLPGETDPTG
ncbi:MAG: lipid-A-disaccharide synthase, partial [Gemmatimonadota bacterium]|nr:lipid-A-disaccharide synthase [Gemmatimonadota bacterium]